MSLWKPISSDTAQGTEGCGDTCETCLISCLPATEVDGNEAPEQVLNLLVLHPYLVRVSGTEDPLMQVL
jgi:hypothetical protein